MWIGEGGTKLETHIISTPHRKKKKQTKMQRTRCIGTLIYHTQHMIYTYTCIHTYVICFAVEVFAHGFGGEGFIKILRIKKYGVKNL